MMRLSKIFLLLCVLLQTLLLAGCGYHLRGSANSGSKLNINSIYLEVTKATLIVNELREQLGYRDIAISPGTADTDRIVQLSNEKYDRRVLSVDDGTGKVTEFELEYRVNLSILSATGEMLAEPQDIILIRDVTFDPALGKLDEEAIVRNEMIRNAADTILFRLQAVD